LSRDSVEALTEELLKAGEEISQVKGAQGVQIQRIDDKLSKAEAESQKTLFSLSDKVEALTGNLLKAGQAASQSQIAYDARFQRFEERAQRKEADCQETLASQRAKVEALTEEFVKAEQAALKTKLLKTYVSKGLRSRLRGRRLIVKKLSPV
jgi:hypothetical protein